MFEDVGGSFSWIKVEFRLSDIKCSQIPFGVHEKQIAFAVKKKTPQKTRQKTPQYRCFSTRMLKGLDGVFLSVLAVFKGLFAGAQTPQLLAGHSLLK